MKKISLLSLGKIADAAARARIAEHCDITEIEEISEEALLHHLPGYEAVIVPFTAQMLVTERVIDAAPQLRLIASTYGGRRVPPEDEASPPMPGVPEALASTESWMRPIGAPLARLLEEGDGADVPRIDLLRSPELVRDLLDPAKLPLGRWPSAADHHLYAAQQAAVAAALEAGGRFGPLVSLNGPPGTGKSWLLRDIVAEIVVRRAKKVAMLESSAEVFHEGALVSFSAGPNRTWSMTPLLPAMAGCLACLGIPIPEALPEAPPQEVPPAYDPPPDDGRRNQYSFRSWRILRPDGRAPPPPVFSGEGRAPSQASSHYNIV